MYQNFSFLKEVLIFTISLVVCFPLYIKKIVTCLISWEDYKTQNAHYLLEKEYFSSACIIDLDTTLSPKYERRDDCCITIPKDNQSQSGHKGDDSSSLDDNIFPHKQLTIFPLKNKEIFKPLKLPTIIHQYPSKEFKSLPSFFGEEEDISAELHILEFEYFLEKFQIIYEDMALSMYFHSLK